MAKQKCTEHNQLLFLFAGENHLHGEIDELQSELESIMSDWFELLKPYLDLKKNNDEAEIEVLLLKYTRCYKDDKGCVWCEAKHAIW